MIPDNITCKVCSSRPARLVMLRRRRGYVDRTFVCTECAGERARLHSNLGVDFDRIITRMEHGSSDCVSAAYSCRLCGTSLAEVIADSKPGCCMCYVRFSAEIEDAARRVHDHTRHVGKAPA